MRALAVLAKLKELHQFHILCPDRLVCFTDEKKRGKVVNDGHITDHASILFSSALVGLSIRVGQCRAFSPKSPVSDRISFSGHNQERLEQFLLSNYCFKVVQEYERAVIFRLGRLMPGGARGPGK